MNNKKQQTETVHKFTRKHLITTLAIIALVLFILWQLTARTGTDGDYDEFAQCLTEKGVIKYGTDWCGYCKKQKEMFGKSFKYINYVNCDLNKAECDSIGVRGYPTWLIYGETYPSVQPLEKLAELSGCEL